MQERRVAEEAALLRRRFPHARAGVDPGAGTGWVYLPAFPLPRGWNRRATELLVIVPAGYPHVPPDSFFLQRGLRDAAGRPLSHYFEEQQGHNPYHDRGWAWFCYHLVTGAWRPAARPLQGD